MTGREELTDDAARSSVPQVQVPGTLFEWRAADDLFAQSKITPTPAERMVGTIISRHQGRANAISIAMLSRATGRDARTIKGIVEQLVTTHRARIGGYRGGDGARVGYAVIVDAADLAATVGPYRRQILSMWRRLRVLLSASELAELHGQLRLEE